MVGIGGWQLVGGSLWVAVGARRRREGGADTTLKAKKHVNVVNYWEYQAHCTEFGPFCISQNRSLLKLQGFHFAPAYVLPPRIVCR